uniref:Uncharacterized protein n=1 Tax=viral metagenome TaxID=1070528 RepID=A0A6C0F8W6_9ZZZZ|tara:strand:- start:15514 stop:15726 length:213 start_codon:yes stop_codon:yes gene_type:complete
MSYNLKSALNVNKYYEKLKSEPINVRLTKLKEHIKNGEITEKELKQWTLFNKITLKYKNKYMINDDYIYF